MEFKVDVVDNIKILRLDVERLDTKIAPDVKAQFLMIFNNSKKDVLVDMSKITYADSSGLGALLLGMRQARDNNGTLKLFGASNRVISLMQIAHLEKVLLNFETEAEALASYNN